MTSHTTEQIKHFRRSLIFTSIFPLLVIGLVGGIFINQNSPSNPSVSVSAATDAAEVRPFDPSHPVYQPIPANVTLHPNSSQIVSNIASSNASFGFDTGGESPPIFIGKATDPLWTISGGCGGRSVQVHAPTNIKAGTGADYPLIILDQANSSYTTSGTQPMEFRMWQATINSGSRTISANGLGIGSYRNDGAILSNVIKNGSNGPFVSRALGQAEACGQNTGSGESYTVGMIRPIDVQRGRIDHAMRVAAGYLRGPANGNAGNKYWHWPALRTEGGSNSGYLADTNSRVPMGARIFLDKSVDVNAVGNAAAARLSDPKNKEFAKIFVKALQEYGMIPLDGTGGGSNVYFEGDATANWSGLMGAKNSYGSYNDISRAVAAVLPWSSLRVADASVFANYATSNTPSPVPAPSPSNPSPAPTPTPSPTTPSPSPSPNPSPPNIPSTPISVPGANGTTPVAIPTDLPVQSDGTLIADFNGDGVNEVVKDLNNDGSIDPTTEIIESVETPSDPYANEQLEAAEQSQNNSTVTIKAGPLPAVKVVKPVAYTFAVVEGLAVIGLGAYLAVTKLAVFAGFRAKLGL